MCVTNVESKINLSVLIVQRLLDKNTTSNFMFSKFIKIAGMNLK
nr:unnamed protein product [Callosobruchus chinensis]